MTKTGKENDHQKINPYLKYSGLAFQLAIVIGFSFWLGMKVDKYVGTEQPIFTILFILLAFSGFMYKLYKELFPTKH